MALKKISQLVDSGALTGNELVEVSRFSATIKIIAATISAQASDNSFNDSGNGFITAGFAVGDQVRVQGFTGNVANNIFSGTVTALAAGKMTIGGTDGDVLVDDAAGESVTITKWVTRRLSASALVGAAVPQAIPVAVSDESTALTTGVTKVSFRMPFEMNPVQEARASVRTAPTGAALIVDINKDTGGGAVSILSTKLSIDAGEKTSTTAAVPAVLSSTVLEDDCEVTIDIDQIGSTIAGAGLKVYLIGVPA